jgi:hypothetical protein
LALVVAVVSVILEASFDG